MFCLEFLLVLEIDLNLQLFAGKHKTTVDYLPTCAVFRQTYAANPLMYAQYRPVYAAYLRAYVAYLPMCAE